MTSEQKGLRLAAGVTMITGLAVALSAIPVQNLPVRLLTDLLFWPLDQGQTLAAETRLALGIGGGLMVGWGLMIWHLSGAPLEQLPEVVRAIIRTSVFAWFTVDSLASFAAGAPLKILGNVVFLALFLLPMRHARTVAQT